MKKFLYLLITVILLNFGGNTMAQEVLTTKQQDII